MAFDVFQGDTLTALFFRSRMMCQDYRRKHNRRPTLWTLPRLCTRKERTGGCMKREGLYMDNMRNEPFSVHPRFSTDTPERPLRARSHTTGGTSTRHATAPRPQLARSCPSIASLHRHPPPKQSPLQHLEGGAVALPHRPPARQQA